jgi:glyoxalase family protein
MIKLTVNFDDPGTYHFYFADSVGSPGSVLTFFPWADIPRGHGGSGLARTTTFRVSRQSIPFWVDRLAAMAIVFDSPRQFFGRETVTFKDPDGLELALVGEDSSDNHPFLAKDIPSEHSIIGFDSISLAVADGTETIRLFTEIFGATVFATEENITRLHLGAAPDGIGKVVDIIETGDRTHGRMGAGAVHHVAFRCASDEEQLMWQERLRTAGHDVTEVQDRCYFHSIYFREPGGILFEIATDPPGFAIDEAPDRLGTSLKLPPWYEERRAAIESRLPKLKLPSY